MIIGISQLISNPDKATRSEAPPPPAHRRPFIKVGVSGVIALIVIARLIWIATSAKLEALKAILSDELLVLETSGAPPITIVRGAKALLAKMGQTRKWEDSRHGVTASYINLVKDRKDFKSYLRSTDITARARALIVANAVKLTQAEADAENVGGFKRAVNVAAAQEFLEVTQRLSRPGGTIFEVARETPKPLLQETVRRGEQIKRVGAEAFKEIKPVGQRLVTELEERKITNPLLGITSLGLLIFMKNKWLAIFLIISLVLVLKNQQITAAKEAVTKVKERVERILP